jgi:hypothetical protein
LPEFLVGDGRDLDLEIDSIQEWSGESGSVPLNLARCADAWVAFIAQISAGTGIHGCHEHEVSRIGQRDRCPGDGHIAVFQRLSENLKDMFLELRQFIEKEDAPMSQ